MLGGVGWLVTAQITSLLRELPKYRETVREKVEAVKQATEGTGRLQEMIDGHHREPAARRSTAPPAAERGRPEGEDGDAAAPRPAPAAPTAVILEPQRAAWMSRMTSFLSPLLEYLGELALSIILVIFMLLKREELRNRVIRLAGHGKIVAATKFVDEAGHRVSRFLLMQAIVNASFGVLFGLGLLAIGVKYCAALGLPGGHAPLPALHRPLPGRHVPHLAEPWRCPRAGARP